MVGNWVVASRKIPDGSGCSTTAFCTLPRAPLRILGPVGCRRAGTCCCLCLKSTLCREGISARVSRLTASLDSRYRGRASRWLKHIERDFQRAFIKDLGRYLTVSEAGRFRVNTPAEINSNESVDRHRRKYFVRKLKSTIVNLHAFCAPVFRADRAKPYNISASIRY